MKLITLDQAYDIWYKMKNKKLYNFTSESYPKNLYDHVLNITNIYSWHHNNFGIFIDLLKKDYKYKII